jgi:hypothetical protein
MEKLKNTVYHWTFSKIFWYVQSKKEFKIIKQAGDVSVCLSLSRLGSENSFQQSLQMETPSGASPFQNL